MLGIFTLKQQYQLPNGVEVMMNILSPETVTVSPAPVLIHRAVIFTGKLPIISCINLSRIYPLNAALVVFANTYGCESRNTIRIKEPRTEQ